MKVMIAFGYFFLSILAPIGLGFLMVVMAPPRLIVDQDALQALHRADWKAVLPRAGSRETFSYPGTVAGISGRQDGGVVRIMLCEGEKQAKEVFRDYAKKTAEAAGVHQSSGPGYHAYRIREKGIAGRIEHMDRVILHAEAEDADAAERLIEASGVLRSNPRANWITMFFRTDKYIPHMILFVLFYSAVQLRIWNRVGSWAARVPPKPGVAAVSEDELRRRLLAINEEDVPFEVVEKKGGKLEATWRLADAKWAGLLTLNKVKELRVIQLRPSEKGNICRALDIGRSIRSTADGLDLGFSLSGFVFRGIIFGQWEYEVQYGFTIRDGKVRFEKVYEYKFSQEELRRPIVEVVTGSGWEYRPVLFISKILGG